MKPRLATIKDIARELNISVATVSRAMRDTYDVSQETREKVLQMAAQLNYKPNFNAIGLVNNKTHNIGIILPVINIYYFSTVVTGIQEVAYSNGYNIILFVTNDSPEREVAITKNLSVTGLDGLIVCISSRSNSCDHFQEVMDNGIPVVFFDRGVPDNMEASKVMQDDYNGAFEAVEHLINNGYSKIAHITGPEGFLVTAERTRGYVDALVKHNLPIRQEWIINSGFSQDHGEVDTYQLLDQPERPDAIFALTDRKAYGALTALKKRNIKIGKEMGLMGFTNDPASSLVSPPLTTIAEPALEIGRTSCELLLKHINKKNFAPREVILPGKLVLRESTLRKVAKHKPEEVITELS